MTIPPRYAPIDTPLGSGWFAYTASGVAVLSVSRTERAFVLEAGALLGRPLLRRDPPKSFARALAQAMERGDGSLADLSLAPPFQRRVLEATAAIPSGETRTYADIARAVGAPRAQRAVGSALARNPVPLIVPCHRVVRSDGRIGEYGMGGEAAKRALLAREGYRAG